MAVQDKFNKSNVIYKITKDIDLEGGTLNIPAGCTLDFQGGSLSNGTIVGYSTAINASLVKIFNTDVNLAGTWDIAESYPEWFGATSGTTNDDAATNVNAIQYCFNNFKTIKLTKIFYINDSIEIRKERISCVGCSSSYSGLYMIMDNKPVFHIIHNGVTFPGLQGMKFSDFVVSYSHTQKDSSNDKSYVFYYDTETPSTGTHGWGWYNSTITNIRTEGVYGFIYSAPEPFWGNHIENIVCYDLGGNFIQNLNTIGGVALNNVYSVKVLNQGATADKEYTHCFDLVGEWNFIGVEIEGFNAESIFRCNGGYVYVSDAHLEFNHIKNLAFLAAGYYNFKNILVNNCNFVNNAVGVSSLFKVNGNGNIQVLIANCIVDYNTRQKLIADNVTLRMFIPGTTEGSADGTQRFRWTGDTPIGDNITLLPAWYYNPWAQDIYINGIRQGMSGDGSNNHSYPTKVEMGEMFLLNNKPIWWNGTAWVDATGATV